jgi:hypothetical protein
MNPGERLGARFSFHKFVPAKGGVVMSKIQSIKTASAGLLNGWKNRLRQLSSGRIWLGLVIAMSLIAIVLSFSGVVSFAARSANLRLLSQLQNLAGAATASGAVPPTCEIPTNPAPINARPVPSLTLVDVRCVSIRPPR